MISVTLRQDLEAKPVLARAKALVLAWEPTEKLKVAFTIPQGQTVRIMGRVEGEQQWGKWAIPLKLAMLVSYNGVEGIVTATDFEKAPG